MPPVEFLDFLAPSDLDALAAIGASRRYERDEALLAQGQVADRVLVLRSGRAKVVSLTPAGTHAVLTFRGPGALIGEQALLDGRPRSATVIALEPVEALSVAASAFRAYLSRRPELLFQLLSMLSERLRDSDRRLAQFAAADTLGRVCARLLELCDAHGEAREGGIRITLPLTQEDLASWTGASIESTARSLRTLRRLGWITTARLMITVHDVDAMRARAA